MGLLEKLIIEIIVIYLWVFVIASSYMLARQLCRPPITRWSYVECFFSVIGISILAGGGYSSLHESTPTLQHVNFYIIKFFVITVIPALIGVVHNKNHV